MSSKEAITAPWPFSVKAAQAKYQSSLEATKKDTPGTSSGLFDINDEQTHQMPVLNHVEMPTLPESSKEKPSARKSPTPGNKRILSQEEFDR